MRADVFGGAIVSGGIVIAAYMYWRQLQMPCVGWKYCNSLPSGVLKDAFPDERTFEQAARASAPPRQDVFLADAANGTDNLWQGNFKLVEDDLLRGLGANAAPLSIAVLRRAGVADAYALRVELVNLKKACLRLFHDAERLLLDLTRIDAFFWHTAARDALAPDKLLLLLHCRQRAKGLVTAIHDARDVSKFICSLPRHPLAADACHKRLVEMPRSLKSALAIERAENFLQDWKSLKKYA